MKVFHVYHHPIQGYEAVKRGFCWPAFFLTWIWAFAKKMWLVGCMIIVVPIAILIVLVRAIGPFGMGISELLTGLLLISVFVGMFGNAWRRSHLAKKGFDRMATVPANTSASAIASIPKS